MFSTLKRAIHKYYPFAKKRLGFNRPVKLFLQRDLKNANNFLGKTAHYDPKREIIVLYISNRHPKDILRSFSHELVHHAQNCRGEFNKQLMGDTNIGYAQENPHLRSMESEAYEKGNMCFRDWEDTLKMENLSMNENKLREQIRGLINKSTSDSKKENINTEKVEEKAQPEPEKPADNDNWYWGSIYKTLKSKWTK